MLGLEVGQIRYGPFCDENGKMVGDGTVFKFADDHAWAITALDSDLDHIQEVVKGIDVAIEPVTEQLPHLQLQGPRSRELLAGLTDADVAGLPYFRFWPDQVEVGGVPCWVSRTGYSGEVGYELFCTPEHAEDLWAAVTGAGARPYGLAAVETIRIESGLIFIGYDYFQHETDPFDMSLDKVIRLDTEDFHGKQALAATAKAPPRRFVTLAVEGSEAPEYGAAVTVDGEPAGTLTSPCESPTLGRVIGLAVLETEHATPGRRSTSPSATAPRRRRSRSNGGSATSRPPASPRSMTIGADGTINRAGIGVTGVSASPFAVPSAEALLVGQQPGDEAFRAAGAAAAAASDPAARRPGSRRLQARDGRGADPAVAPDGRRARPRVRIGGLR